MISSVKTISLTAFTALFLLVNSIQLNAQCFEIESILIDACGLGTLEGENEMIRFKVGLTPLNSNNITANFPTANSFLGMCMNGASASATAALNATITGCGFLIEPPGGILPANANVLFLTSTDVDVNANSFANLNDTLYIIFQCAGNTSGHFGNSSAGIKTFSMSFSAPPGCSDVVSWNNSNLVGGNGALVNFDPPGNSTFTNNGCQAPFTPISISASAFVSSSLQICPGDSINLYGTLTGPIDSVKWSGGLGTFSDAENDTTTYFSSTNETDSFYLKIRGFTSCTSGVADSVLVYFVDSSDVSILEGTTADLCSGATLTLNASGANNYLWSSNSTSNSITINSANQYFVTDTTNKCFPDTAFIMVNSITQPTVTISENDSSICQGETLTLHANGANNYTWNNSQTTDSINVITSGTYFVYANLPCPSDTDSVVVTVVQPTNVSITEPNPSVICEGASLTLHATPLSNNYTWSNSAITNSIVVNSGGTYSVNFSDGVCPNTSASIVITEQNLPTATILGESTFCQDESLYLEASGNGSFSWSNGDIGIATIISTPQTLILTATNFCGTDTDQINITSEDCDDSTYLFIPNVITPNNDGINDFFSIEGVGVTSISVKIYNRWGKSIYEYNDINSYWDGRDNSDGTYFYVAEITFINDEKEVFKGALNLLK